MKILKSKKAMIMVICILTMCIGGCCLLYEKNKSIKNINIVETFEIEDGIAMKNESQIEVEQDNENEKNEICVYVVGEVKNSGVFKLVEGSRIIDALELAGGATEQADLDRVNLAFVISDGQKITIPNINNKNSEVEYVSYGSGDNMVEGEGTVYDNNDRGKYGKININTASQTELETLDGIGPSLANRIIVYRKENGRFRSIKDIMNVSGIGEAKFEGIKGKIVVD